MGRTAKPSMATRPTKSSFALVNPNPPEVPKMPSSILSACAQGNGGASQDSRGTQHSRQGLTPSDTCQNGLLFFREIDFLFCQETELLPLVFVVLQRLSSSGGEPFNYSKHRQSGLHGSEH